MMNGVISLPDAASLYRGYLLFGGEYQIYFIECGEKNQYFPRVRSTSENADIFTTRAEIYLVFAEKKSKFSFYFILNGMDVYYLDWKHQ